MGRVSAGRRGALLLVLMTAAVLTFASARTVRADDPEERQVEEFLSRLGLVDLQIRHLERVLDATDSKQQLPLARRLADLYAARLMSAADDKERYDDILARIRKLGERHPEANTTAIQVMLLQADYNRAELQIGKWIEDRGDAEALKSGAAILSRIAPQLQAHQEELNEEVEKLAIAVEGIEKPALKEAKEQELRRKREVAGRATFFAGWSNYYFGLTQLSGGDAKTSLDAARAAFRRILGLGAEEKYDEVEVEWLGLESSFRSRALIGLGLTEAAAGDLAGANRLFTLLDDVSAPPEIRDQAPAFYLQGLLNASQVEEALKFAQQQVDGFSGAATQGKVSFCTSLVRAGFGGPKDSPPHRALGELGVRGLARMQQIAAAYQVLTKYNVELADDGGFYLVWLKGYGQFAEAEKTKSEDDYRAAAETLRQAIDDPQARKDVASAGQCRYSLAWSLYRLKEYEKAAEEFQHAATSLKGASGDTAVQSAWMAFASYYSLTQEEPRFALSAIDALEGLKRDFPGSDQAKKADIYIMKLRQNAASPIETIRELLRVRPDDDGYLSARYDLCRLQHQLWSAEKDDAKKKDAGELILRQVEVFSRAARNDDNAERKLKCQLWAADVAINGVAFDAALSGEILAKAEALVPEVTGGSSALTEYHYRRLQFAQKSNNESMALEESAWLAENAAGSAYELSALITLAKDVEDALSKASAADRQAQLERAGDVYRNLARAVGESPKVIAEVKNAQVANARLAQYEYDLGNYGAAADRAQRLLAAFPDDRNYLRLAGLAEYYAGDYSTAIERWRLLVQGLTKNTAPWHEAKYYQLASLMHTDKPAAVMAYQQFDLLYPSVAGEPWASDREGLRKALGE
ncbi:MAG: hypothetical protein RIC55_01350 [Pirellulaceae bacterium]